MKPFKALTQAIARLFSRSKPYEPLKMHGKAPLKVVPPPSLTKPIPTKPTPAEARRERQNRPWPAPTTGRVSSAQPPAKPAVKSHAEAHRLRVEEEQRIRRQNEEDAARRRRLAQEEEEEETRRRNASSWSQSSPAYESIFPTPEPERTYSPAPSFVGGGGSFDGGGSSGDWSSPSDSGSSSSCDSGGSSGGCD